MRMTFAFVSDDQALDFVGTVGRRRSEPVELLSTPEDLARWLAESGAVDNAVQVGRLDLELALQLREAIYRLAIDCTDGTPHRETDVDLINRVSALGQVRRVLHADGSIERSGDAAAALSTVAASAIDLVGGHHRALIRECSASDCTRLYVDTSSRGTRRWCSMQLCGNRAKAAKFRSRGSKSGTQLTDSASNHR